MLLYVILENVLIGSQEVGCLGMVVSPICEILSVPLLWPFPSFRSFNITSQNTKPTWSLFGPGTEDYAFGDIKYGTLLMEQI